MKAFHLFLLVFLYAACTNPHKEKVDRLDKELVATPILSFSFDSLMWEVRKLPSKHQMTVLRGISARNEEEIDGLLKQKRLLNENLPRLSKKEKKKIALRLLELYVKLTEQREPEADIEGIRLSEELEAHYSLSREERWKIRKIRAELLNRRGLHEEFLPIWFELLAEHRQANKTALVIEDLYRIANYFVILGDQEKGLDLCKEAYQLAVTHHLSEWKKQGLINLIRLLYGSKQYAEILNLYETSEGDTVSLSYFTYPILADCYLHLNKPEEARFYLFETDRTKKAGNGMTIYCRIAETYIAENKEDSAFIFFQKAMEQFQHQAANLQERNIKATLPFYFLPICSSLAALYQHKSKNRQAARLFRLVEPLMKKPAADPRRLEMQTEALTRYSSFYKATGCYKDALDLLTLRDSIQQIIHTASKERADKNLMERLQIKDLMHTIEMQKIELTDSHRLLAALGTCVFLFLSLMGVIFHLFYQRRKKLVAIHKRKKEREGPVQSPVIAKQPPLNPQEILFNAAQKKVISEKLFQNSALSLEVLAHKLKTNRTYLSASINTCAGCNFNQWINDFRVEYILKRIHSGQKLSVLAQQAGFVSTDAFYRNFKRKTHLTPHEYLKRQMASQDDISL